jgi:hypothetical protein
MLDIFRTNPAFNVNSLTEAFNVVPNNYGRLQEMGLFVPKPITTSVAFIERQNGVLNVLPSVPRGGPASKGSRGSRDLKAVVVPHFPHEDVVLAEEVAGVRRFGTEADLESVQGLITDKLAVMGLKHDITLETLKWSALEGIVLDPVTGVELANMFDLFGGSLETMAFDLDDSSTEVAIKINALLRYLETHTFGDTITGVRVMCGWEFMDALVTHPSTEKAYKEFSSAQDPLRNDVRRMFKHKGVVFEEHVGSSTKADGTVIKFVEDDEAKVICEGTNSTYRTFVAPADFMETVNTPGQLRYAKQEVMKWDRGVDLLTESNPLPVVLRPQLLVKLTIN